MRLAIFNAAKNSSKVRGALQALTLPIVFEPLFTCWYNEMF